MPEMGDVLKALLALAGVMVTAGLSYRLGVKRLNHLSGERSDRTSIEQFNNLTQRFEALNATLLAAQQADRVYYDARIRECEERCMQCEAEHAEAKRQITQLHIEIDILNAKLNQSGSGS